MDVLNCDLTGAALFQQELVGTKESPEQLGGSMQDWEKQFDIIW